MITTGRHIREARLLLGLAPATLAASAKVGVTVVTRAEQVDGILLLIRRNAAIQRALEAASVEFIPENGGEAGVRLRKVEP